MSQYVASVSFGKDSLAMLLILLETGAPLDEVIFYDTGMEFKAIYDTRDRVVPMLEAAGVKYTELRPQNPFLYDMLERPVFSGKKGHHAGYGWCGGRCRWGTELKTRTIDKHVTGAAVHYVGIAKDEPERIARLALPKVAPLAEWKMTEADCLQYCYERGFYWEENRTRLYEILDRVSCWCCANKNKKELRNIYRHLPEYWERLKEIQARLERPMKKYKSKKYGEYGNLFDLERVFAAEEGGGAVNG